VAVLMIDELQGFITYGRQELQFYKKKLLTTPFTNLMCQLSVQFANICK